MGRNDMIITDIDVAGYWDIILFVNIDYKEWSEIEEALKEIGASEVTINKIYNTISNKYNRAFTYSNLDKRVSVIGINKTTSKEELLDSVIHEIDHVQGDICKYYDINLDSEPAAYLIGYLAKSFYKSCSKLFCYY